MSTLIDARGYSCPEPVIMLKKAMAGGESSYEMLVDNRVSVENATRYATHQGYRVDVTEEGNDFRLRMEK
ncbi:MAG: sulfurtransferase TusA family protein [Lachnospiraceae bacterium]